MFCNFCVLFSASAGDVYSACIKKFNLVMYDYWLAVVIVTIGMQQTQANYDAQITFGHLIKKDNIKS